MLRILLPKWQERNICNFAATCVYVDDIIGWWVIFDNFFFLLSFYDLLNHAVLLKLMFTVAFFTNLNQQGIYSSILLQFPFGPSAGMAGSLTQS